MILIPSSASLLSFNFPVSVIGVMIFNILDSTIIIWKKVPNV